MSHNFETFSTPYEGLFLVFGVPNAKYLAFGTPDGNALKAFTTPKLLFHIIKTLKIDPHEVCQMSNIWHLAQQTPKINPHQVFQISKILA